MFTDGDHRKTTSVKDMKAICYCAGSLVVLFLVLSIASVNAQQPGNMTKIIQDKVITEFLKIHPEDEKCINTYCKASIPFIFVEYESPTTIVLSGDLIVTNGALLGEFNSILWSAMDHLINQYGFKLQQVLTSGIGTQGNPTVAYILMTK